MSRGSAIFSECGRYRYRLDRVIGDGPPLAFLLHNPSSAGAEEDDATSRRGIGFARSLGFGHLIFINPWAFVATKPSDLWSASDPVGLLNDAYIEEAASEVYRQSGKVVAAWGRISPPAALRSSAIARLAAVIGIVERGGGVLFALGMNKDRSPKHPLYLRKDAELSIWDGTDSHRS